MRAIVRAKINCKRNKTVTKNEVDEKMLESKPEDSTLMVQDAIAYIVNTVFDQIYEIELSKID